MYRVELKAVHGRIPLIGEDKSVPNVPCGVESGQGKGLLLSPVLFLMYRVELKATQQAKIFVNRNGS